MRMRVIGWEVRPVIMADDGEDLTSVPVQPQMVARSAWQAFKDGGDDAAIDNLREQLEADAPDS